VKESLFLFKTKQKAYLYFTNWRHISGIVNKVYREMIVYEIPPLAGAGIGQFSYKNEHKFHKKHAFLRTKGHKILCYSVWKYDWIDFIMVLQF